MPMVIGMVMTFRKNKINYTAERQQQTVHQQQAIQSQPSYVNSTSMNRINLHSMRLGSNYSMNSLYNSPYRSSG